MVARYALIDGTGTVVNVTLWDGSTHSWQPPDHLDAILAPDEAAIGWVYDGKEWTAPVPPPPPVPEVISDRQFFQALAMLGLISQDEALAAVKTGDLPQVMTDAIAKMPGLSDDDRFGVQMLLCGATQFLRNHPAAAMLGAALNKSDAEIDDLWRLADTL